MQEHLQQPSTSTSDEKLEKVRAMVLKDRRVTITETAQKLNVNQVGQHSQKCTTALGSTRFGKMGAQEPEKRAYIHSNHLQHITMKDRTS
jgi:hypothetical protein